MRGADADRAHCASVGVAAHVQAGMPLPVNDSLVDAGTSLEVGLIGNCSFNALVDEAGSVVWCCMPRPARPGVLPLNSRTGSKPGSATLAIRRYSRRS